MNASKLLASSAIALAALTGGAAFAQSAPSFGGGDIEQAHGTSVQVSQASRADVKAEYLQALRDGTLFPVGDTNLGYEPQVASTANRSDVHAGAVVAARQSASPLADEEQAHGVDIAAAQVWHANAALQARAEGGTRAY